MIKISIFTPTFNRSELLNNVFKFLSEEDYLNFEWIIVDDGSIDDTKEVVENFKLKSNFEIRYYYQENRGKHVAYNTAIDKAEGDLFICIDSDDIYEKGSLNKLVSHWVEESDEELSGICYLSRYKDGEIIGTEFPMNNMYSNLIDIYYRYGVLGDKGIMFNTAILKKYRFPVIENEKFLTESVLYSLIGLEYNMKFINEIYEIKEYQKNGLSEKYRTLVMSNPKGALLNYSLISKYKPKGLLKYKNTIQLLRFIFINGFRSNWLKYFKESNSKLTYTLLTPMGWVISKLYRV